MNKESTSYKRGFAKGCEIYSKNLRDGYYADANNKRAVNVFRHYAETGFKKDIRLNEGQKEYFAGMADGIEYKYKQGGTPLSSSKPLSNFEKYENQHYYGTDNSSNNVDDEVFN